ncbi:MAG: hypothetical protein KDA55_09560 [Planctomycetales bacterium]|nr:hypothetical protein [Planctomycetales bacterium]MCA9208590.1 hypothetical protein [Planctomycetales bacterium]MCA9227834.1 hypothetical protein [Planctomycetales bacterium]
MEKATTILPGWDVENTDDSAAHVVGDAGLSSGGEQPMDKGKLAIVGIFGVSIGMAVFAWWYRYEQGNQSLAFWGSETAVLINGAQRVELLKLAESTDEPVGESIDIDGRAWNVEQAVDVTQARGMLHARHSLVEDVTFRWDEAVSDNAPAWTYALRFEGNGQTSIVAFDTEQALVHLVGSEQSALIQPDISAGFQRIFDRELSAGESSAAENTLMDAERR